MPARWHVYACSDGGHKALCPPSLAGAATTSRRLAAQAAHGELLSHLPPARGSVTALTCLKSENALPPTLTSCSWISCLV